MLLNNYQLSFFNIDATTLKPRIQHWTLKAGQLMTLRHLRCWWGCLMTSWSLWHLVRAGGQSATTFMWIGPPAEQRALKPGLYFIQRQQRSSLICTTIPRLSVGQEHSLCGGWLMSQKLLHGRWIVFMTVCFGKPRFSCHRGEQSAGFCHPKIIWWTVLTSNILF